MKILIVTGEASGDLHGAHLAKAIMMLDPTAQLVGIGGSGMRAAGVSLVPGVPQLDVMGLIGLSAIRAMIQRVRAIRRVLKAEAWDLVVLIDNPGLNFHFARVAKAAGRRVLYYIAPQVWAWRPGRMKWPWRIFRGGGKGDAGSHRTTVCSLTNSRAAFMIARD